MNKWYGHVLITRGRSKNPKHYDFEYEISDALYNQIEKNTAAGKEMIGTSCYERVYKEAVIAIIKLIEEKYSMVPSKPMPKKSKSMSALDYLLILKKYVDVAYDEITIKSIRILEPLDEIRFHKQFLGVKLPNYATGETHIETFEIMSTYSLKERYTVFVGFDPIGKIIALDVIYGNTEKLSEDCKPDYWLINMTLETVLSNSNPTIWARYQYKRKVTVRSIKTSMTEHKWRPMFDKEYNEFAALNCYVDGEQTVVTIIRNGKKEYIDIYYVCNGYYSFSNEDCSSEGTMSNYEYDVDNAADLRNESNYDLINLARLIMKGICGDEGKKLSILQAKKYLGNEYETLNLPDAYFD